MYFLINAYPPKLLDLVNSNFAGALFDLILHIPVNNFSDGSSWVEPVLGKD